MARPTARELSKEALMYPELDDDIYLAPETFIPGLLAMLDEEDPTADLDFDGLDEPRDEQD